MRIVYIAKHGSGYNNDEDAISDALRQLGHEVLCLKERGKGLVGIRTKVRDYDLLLFHKWFEPSLLPALKIPKVFWYFDLVDYPSDSTLSRRCQERVRWMDRMIPLVKLGFCTDGDWVQGDKTGKLIKLTQGADHRFIGRGETHKVDYDLLFTGLRRGGRERISFVQHVTAKYGDRFRHQLSGCYGQWLANLIASSRIVLAPDSPITDHYWSNRVYVSSGFGAFMLHPYCRDLTEHYTNRQEIVYYHSVGEMDDLIEFYLHRPLEREGISRAALERTRREHTYLQRCGELIQTVQERLF